MENTVTPPAKIKEATFIGVAWGGVALACIFFIFRIAARIKVFRRIYADDVMVLIACLFLLINTLIWQTSKDNLYLTIAVASGQLYPPPPDIAERAQTYLRGSGAVIALFYSGLWAIKLSFMLFFRRLGHNVSGQRVLWWTVLFFVVATWFACLGTIEYHCLSGSFEYIQTTCNDPGTIAFDRNTLRWNMIMDVVTDALIILVPTKLLWNVQISLRKKVALAGVFSITVIIMAFAIIRVVLVSSFSHQLDQTWLYMWSSIEQTVSILVACLASFRGLFTKSNRPTPQRISDEAPKAIKKLAPKLTMLFGSDFTVTLFDTFTKHTVNDVALDEIATPVSQAQTVVSASKKNQWDQYNDYANGSAEHILPLNKVHVRHEISTT